MTAVKTAVRGKVMKFCPDCGTRLLLIQKADNNKTYPFLVCSKCNYQRRATSDEITLSKTVGQSKTEQIAVINRKHANLRTMPTTKVQCTKCNNKEAFWWFVQTRGSDESPTQFFRCTKCSYTWREMA